jgi:hypothetical protein
MRVFYNDHIVRICAHHQLLDQCQIYYSEFPFTAPSESMLLLHTSFKLTMYTRTRWKKINHVSLLMTRVC